MTQAYAEQLLNPRQVASILGIGKNTAYRLIAKGEIPSLLIVNGNTRRIFRVRPTALESWLTTREVGNKANVAAMA